MRINTDLKNDVLYVMLDGELDEYASAYVKESLDKLFQFTKFNDVIFDMRDLNFMDSTGIGILLGRYKYLKSKNKSIYISNANPTIEKIIKMSGIYQIMPKIS